MSRITSHNEEPMKKNIFLTVVMIISLCIALSACAQTSNINYVPANRTQNNTANNAADNTNTAGNTNNSSNSNNTASNTGNNENNTNNTSELSDIWVCTKTEEINNLGQIIGAVTTYDYNEYGDLLQKQVVSESQPEKNETTEYEYSYDESGKMLTKKISAPNETDEFKYEYENDVISFETRSHFNGEGVLTYTHDITYNKSGNKSFFIDIRYNTDGEAVYRAETTYEYDKEGNLIKEDIKTVTTGDELTITYTYDERGNLLSLDAEPEDNYYSDVEYAYEYSSYDNKLLKIIKTTHPEEDTDYKTEYRYDYTYWGTKFKESSFTIDKSEYWNVTEYDNLEHEAYKFHAAYFGGPALEGSLSKITWMRLSDYLAAKEQKQP